MSLYKIVISLTSLMAHKIKHIWLYKLDAKMFLNFKIKIWYFTQSWEVDIGKNVLFD